MAQDAFWSNIENLLAKPIPDNQSRMFTNDTIQRDRSKAIGQPVTFLESQASQAPKPQVSPKGEGAKLGQTEGSIEDAFKGINTVIADLNKATDPTEKQQKLRDLEASTGTLIADWQKKARLQAETEGGVLDLRTQLKAREEADKAHPLWARYQSDSKPTAAVRQRLAQAEATVDKAAARILQENGELQRLVKTVDATMAMQSRIIERGMNRADKKMEAQEEIMSAFSGIPPEVRGAFIKDNPAMADDAVFTSSILNAVKTGSVQDRDNWARLVKGEIRPENFMQEGLAGSKIAMRLALAEQADRTGLPRESLVEVARSAERFLAEPEFALEEMKRFGLLKPDQIKEIKTKSLTGDKDTQKALLAGRMGMVDSYLAVKQKDLIDGDVTKWPTDLGGTRIEQLPGAVDVITKFKEVSGKNPGIRSFMSSYMNQPGITKEEKAQRAYIVTETYRTALNKLNAGVFGKGIDSSSNIRALQELQVRSALENARAGSFIGSLGGGYRVGFDRTKQAALDVLGLATRKPDLITPVQEFFSGFRR